MLQNTFERLISLDSIIYLSMKESNLFCFVFVVMRFTEPGCFKSSSWCVV